MSETVTIKSTVDPLWIEFCTRDRDVFGASCCGSFLFGIDQDDDLGWLVFEHEEKHTVDNVPNEKKAVAAWRAGESLPKGYYRLDSEAAKKAWIEGVKWRGEKWYDNGDAIAYQYAIQRALFDEERYA
jgi:hypothetical protein